VRRSLPAPLPDRDRVELFFDICRCHSYSRFEDCLVYYD
jgi:hypothetical protein